jgi:amino acid permease
MIVLKIFLWIMISLFVVSLGYFCLRVLHDKLMIKTWYAWIYESIMYRKNLRIFNRLSINKKMKIHVNWILYPRRFHKFWTGKKFIKKLEKEIGESLN